MGSHSKEIEREDGRKELVLIEDENAAKQEGDDENRKGVFNVSKHPAPEHYSKHMFAY